MPHKHWTGKNCPSLLLGEFESFVSGADAIRTSIIATDEALGVEALGSADYSENELRGALNPEPVLELEASSIEEDGPENEHELIAEALEAYVTQ